jgi:hypothetical protein
MACGLLGYCRSDSRQPDRGIWHAPFQSPRRSSSRLLSGLARSIVYESIFVVAALPTVLFLVLAATFHWRDDHQNPNGSWSVGYTTVGLNMNVVLLFILGIVAARQGGFGLRWILLFGVFNACLGLAIVNVDLELR